MRENAPVASRSVGRPGATGSPLEIAAPAKINLYLRVVGKRPDGYHELESLFCPIGLFDRLTLAPAAGVTISCDAAHQDAAHRDAAHVPADDTNLAHRAAVLFFKALSEVGKRSLPTGVHIDLQKWIPVGAGLGGGSSDAAAVLKGLNKICGDPFDADRLRRLALSLGADCPFFIDGRPALATGIGERLEPFPNLPKCYAIVIFPGIHTPTAEVYKKLNLRLTKSQKKISYFDFTGHAPDTDACQADICGNRFDFRRHLVNDLESVTEMDHPEIRTAKSMLLEEGALGALMSGSGSSVFGLFRTEPEARRVMSALPPQRGWRYYLAPLLV